MKTKAIQGFKDILPDEAICWQHIENTARDIFHRFGFNEIRTPVMEETELFARSIGQATDIVEKEMYTFVDKGITLRPEGTASLLRAFIENALHLQQPVQKLYTIGPMFRHERPQKGRLRQFHQLDVEIIGADQPEVDAELMAMGEMLLDRLGLTANLEINSLGCPACRPAFREKLVSYLEKYRDKLCQDCQRRTETNPLRVLDCKKKYCKELVKDAPSILDSLCRECDDHFQAVQECLDSLDVSYTVNHFMVRGLDYYSRTTFEFIADNLGAQSAVGAGGRYDGLIKQLGGTDISGIGFAMGIERLILLIEQQSNDKIIQGMETDIFVAALGTTAARYGQTLVHQLRKDGLRAAIDYSGRSLKAQMKQAGRVRARYALIIGDNELEQKTAVLRDMRTKNQVDISLKDTPDENANNLQRTMKESLPVNERPDLTGSNK